MENVMENVVENVTLSYHIKLILPMYSEQQSHSTKSQISGKLWLSDPCPAQRDRWKLMADFFFFFYISIFIVLREGSMLHVQKWKQGLSCNQSRAHY